MNKKELGKEIIEIGFDTSVATGVGIITKSLVSSVVDMSGLSLYGRVTVKVASFALGVCISDTASKHVKNQVKVMCKGFKAVKEYMS